MKLFARAAQSKPAVAAVGAASLLFFLFLVLLPLFNVFTRLSAFQFTGEMAGALATSFAVAAAATGIDLVFGVPLAWMLARRKMRFQAVADALVDIPLIVPTSALGFSVALFWGAGGAGLLQPGIPLLVLLHVVFTFPYVVRVTQAAIISVDASLGMAARSLGASPFLSFRSVWLPLFRGGVAAGAILAFTRSLGETGATMMVAGASKTVPVLVLYFKNASPQDMDAAISLSAVMILASAAIFTAARILGRQKASYALGKVYVDLEKRLSGNYGVGDAASLLFFSLFVLVPSFFFLKFAFTGFGISDAVTSAMAASFFIAAAATLLTLLFGLPLAFVIASKKPGAGAVELLVDLSLLIPTVSMGISLSIFWGGWANEWTALVLAHAAMIFSYFVKPVSSALKEMDASLVEVARTLGADPLYAFRTVVIPLIKPTVLAGMVVAFMRSVSETGGTLAVSRGIKTVPVLIVDYVQKGALADAAGASLLLLAVSVVAVVLLRKSLWRG